MATNYTTLLKLALPTSGELTGTWGDTVNQNITSMIEEAVAGKAVINTWTGNAHTIGALPNGTTGDGRAAILELTDSGAQLTGAATLNIPTFTKVYVVINETGRDVTVKPSGTGVTVSDGYAVTVACDGTDAHIIGSEITLSSITDWPAGVSATEVGYLDGVTSSIQTQLNSKQASGSYQAADADLTAIAGISDTSGFLKKTAANTWSLDTSSYLTAHPNISAAPSSDNSGRTYIQDITVDSNGHITGLATATETVVNTNTTYSISAVDSGSDAIIRLTAGGSGSGSDDVKLVAGANVTLTPSGDNITIASTNTVYTHPDDGGGNQSALTGAAVYSDITINTAGHVTATTTRDLTLANLGAGSLASLSSVGSSEIAENAVGASELNVSGNGTSGQFLRTDGDGSFTWETVTIPPSFPSGTLMLFQQTAAPTGWTKQTTHDDKALRVVSGTASSGGTSAFSTAMGTPSVSGSVGISGSPAVGNLAVSVSGNIAGTTLSVNTIPSHSHNVPTYNATGASSARIKRVNGTSSGNIATGNTGGNGAHNHGHNLSGTLNGAPSAGNLAGALSSSTAAINVQYVDLIIASKD